MKKTYLALLLSTALATAITGCVSASPKRADIHQQMNVIRAQHAGVNIDQWPEADRTELHRLLDLELKAK